MCGSVCVCVYPACIVGYSTRNITYIEMSEKKKNKKQNKKIYTYSKTPK